MFLQNFKNNNITLSVGEREWIVKVNQSQSYYRLGRGWRDFVNDNDLSINDVLLFENIGAGHYNVSMFKV